MKPFAGDSKGLTGPQFLLAFPYMKQPRSPRQFSQKIKRSYPVKQQCAFLAETSSGLRFSALTSKNGFSRCVG